MARARFTSNLPVYDKPATTRTREPLPREHTRQSKNFNVEPAKGHGPFKEFNYAHVCTSVCASFMCVPALRTCFEYVRKITIATLANASCAAARDAQTRYTETKESHPCCPHRRKPCQRSFPKVPHRWT